MKKSKRPKRKKFPYIPESIFDHENWGGDDEYNFDKPSTVGQIIFKIFIGTILIGATFLFVQFVDYKIINNKCTTLENQSQEFETFYVTYLEKVACDGAGFTFAGTKDAPVHVDTIPEGEELQADVWYSNDLGKWVANINHNYLNE